MSTDRNHTEDIDNLNRHLAQADAMATIITAEGMECFDAWNERIRQEYLWALADKIKEARAAADKMLGNTPTKS